MSQKSSSVTSVNKFCMYSFFLSAEDKICGWSSIFCLVGLHVSFSESVHCLFSIVSRGSESFLWSVKNPGFSYGHEFSSIHLKYGHLNLGEILNTS